MPKETLTDVFARADLGSRAVALLERDPHFGELGLNYAPGVGDHELILNEFLERAHAPALEKTHIARWILEQYLTHRHNGKPIQIEDFYKIGDNIRYFDALKTQPVFNGEKDLTRYKTYADFEAAIAPHREAKMRKEETFRLRTIPDAVRAETTMLYEGEDGFVVIPHTVAASKFWGKNTKWCIAGDKDAEKMFPHYNRISPIVMILPAETPWKKVALADRAIFDSQDEKIGKLPKEHELLIEEVRTKLSLEAGDVLTRLMQPEDLSRFEDYEYGVPQEDDPIWNDPESLKELIRDYPFSSSDMPSDMRADRALALDLIEENPCFYAYVHTDLMVKDGKFERESIDRNGFVLEHIGVKDVQEEIAFIGEMLRTTNDLPFSWTGIWLRKLLPVSDEELHTHQRAALNRLADAGDVKRLKKNLRVMKEFWGNAELILAPTVEGVRAVLAAPRAAAKNKMKVGMS